MSNPSPAFRIARAFDLDGAVTDVRPLGNGLINDTFLVTTDNREHAVMQRINRRAFPQPALIMKNLRALTEHLASLASDGTTLRLPQVRRTRDGHDYVIDAQGEFWRMLDYVEQAVSVDTIQSIDQAREVGAGLGSFHVLVAKMDPASLQGTRPGFHQTPLYYTRFTDAVARATSGADATLNDCLNFARARHADVSVLEDAKRDRALRVRVIHGDPKLDNFLFDASDGHVVSLIDLDTVQPGLLQYDIGDCLRSACNPAGESPTRLDDVRFDLDICRALLERYLAAARAILSTQDIAYLYHAIRLIPFELGLRFLTDHLDGDVYFKTDWRGHNLHRAQVQFRLTADIESKEVFLRQLIDGLARTA